MFFAHFFSHRNIAWKIHLHWATLLGFKLPDTSKGLGSQRGPQNASIYSVKQIDKDSAEGFRENDKYEKKTIF